jgi:hypothetical protein
MSTVSVIFAEHCVNFENCEGKIVEIILHKKMRIWDPG